ncbi:hypothetical protein FSP39_008243 [Pinctada imbricata]|uniref:Methionine adenosyltransferase 2 subunit beta n=1 Tax=Pinctada imbricata TaxID=66713 RepID=A0AA88Y6U1_PINIB|nr:hypothetical protein FSP39_008243 [Pinctada imbricata]
MTKRVLITGASGLLGRACRKEFVDDKSWEVLGLAFSRACSDLRKVDITDETAVRDIITGFKPNIVIHCAAERRPDVVEKKSEETRNLNVEATRYICQEAGKIGAWVLYISTDYVFDGKSPPYKEDAEPNPLNLYGISKRQGEVVTLQVSQENSVLRVPILYGQIEKLSESAVTVLFEKVKDTANTCLMSDYERRYPTHCADIAFVIRQLADKRLQDGSIKGIYHWSGNENMTKNDMAIAMAKAFNLPTNHIQGDKNPSGGAKRPYDAQLDCSRIEALGFGRQTPFKDGIADVLKPYL